VRISLVPRGLILAAAACLLIGGPGPRAQEPRASDAPAAEVPAQPTPQPPPRRAPRPQPPAATQAAQAPAAAPPEAAPEPQPEAQAPEPAEAAAPPPPPPAKGRLEAGTPIPPAELEALVDGAVQQAMAAGHVPGVTVSVVQNGQVILKKGYGLSSLSPARPVDPDRTLFRVGSISKLFTWTLVMKEVEHGRMRLDGPVNLYLPEPLQVRDQGYLRQVLLRDLMTHSAGFETKTLGRLIELKPNRVRALNTYLRQERPRRIRAPGVLPEYSNYGAGLAGAAVAQVTGQPYMDLVEADILRPLKLGHTTFREPYPADPALPAPMPAPLAADAAQGFAWRGAGYDLQPYEYMSQLAPAGSASSTAGDMARLMQLILANGTLDGTMIYGPQTAAAFRTVILRSGPGVQGWASGFMERPLPGGFDSFGHEGQTLNFRSNLVTVPALNLGIFVSANSDGGAALAETLPAQIVERFYAPPAEPPQPSPDLYAMRSAYAGDYLSEDRRYGGLEQFVALLSDRVRIDVSPDGLLRVTGKVDDVLVPAGQAGQFREIGGAGRGAGFQFKDDKAIRWFDPNGGRTYERVGLLWRRRWLLAATMAALACAGATLIGIFTRDRREFRQTDVQGRASAIQTATAILWIVAAACFSWWALRALNDPAVGFAEWPGPWVVIASSSALVATLCSLGQTLMLPVVWRGGRRVESWTAWRKLRFTGTALIFLAFGVLLMLWGALEPWSA
jgi:CubicO group peptidase (beta-lactamase class C family)